jgi:transcriptional regulator with XRE-family HTH domain
MKRASMGRHMSIPQDIGARLFELRDARGWSQRELSARARTSQVTITKVETGRVAPRLVTVRKLARAFDMTAEEFMYGGGPGPGGGGDWRAKLREASPAAKRDMALAASEGGQWPGNVSTRTLGALKAFCARYGVTPEDVLAALVAETPGLSETLDALNARAKERAERYAQEAEQMAAEAAAELDATLRRGRDAG